MVESSGLSKLRSSVRCTVELRLEVGYMTGRMKSGDPSKAGLVLSI